MNHGRSLTWVVLSVPLLAICLESGATFAENIDPNNDGSQYAWAENVGWLNAEPLDEGGPGVLVTDFTLTGWIWGENTGWISLSCDNTSSCGSLSYGVANDGAGHLSGFAWSENLGWINFAPVTGGVVIDPATGVFSGTAWGENVGWITFSSPGPVVFKVQTSWCQATAGPPSGIPLLTAAPSGMSTLLAWSSLAGASWYDVVMGDLGVLSSTAGDFTMATQACAIDNNAGTSYLLSQTPSVGQAYWFLVRGANCRGSGTYESGGPAQVGLRDPEIALSSNRCP